jgi:archaemetzincin
MIAEDVTREYHYPVIIKEVYADLNQFYDPTRRQYDGNKLLLFLDSLNEKDCIKTIGLFQVDLFIPILTYIFGQAIFNGKTGIVSIYRLRNEQYGLKQDESLLLARFRKVVIHELGHTFGLAHCHVPSCVMRGSTYVEDIDQKKHNLCNKCRTELEAFQLSP